MTYANFKEAYIDGDMQATRIALAVDKALEKLAPSTLRQRHDMWDGMCSTAWAFHVQAQQEKE